MTNRFLTLRSTRARAAAGATVVSTAATVALATVSAAFAAGLAAGPARTGEVWGACADDEARPTTVARTYDRGRGDDGLGHVLRAGVSRLRCGSEKYGYEHILTRHQVDWTREAYRAGVPWRAYADAAVATVLADPDAVSYRHEAGTYCYSRTVMAHRRGGGAPVGEGLVKAIVSGTSADVITAYPAERQCEEELRATTRTD